MTDKYYVIETVFGYLECVDGIMLRSCRILYNKSVKRFKSIKTAKAFIKSSNSKYLTKQYGLKIIPVFRKEEQMCYIVKTGNLYVSGFCPIVGTPDIKKAVYWEDKNCAETIAVELGGVIVELKEPPRTEKEEK